MKDKDESVYELNPRRNRLREFFAGRASVRELIAEEAADWFVANREGLDSRQRAEFATWLRASPQNIEEYLNIASIGRDLRAACDDPELPFEDLMKRALETEDGLASARPPDPPRSPSSKPGLNERQRWLPQPWLSALAALAALGAVALAFVFWKNNAAQPDRDAIAYHIQTRHGEQVTQQLPDHSILKLDTDTEVSVRLDRTQRVVRVIQGRAEFKVAHEPARRFLVQAGTVRITDIGTEFDVYARPDSTVVTVVEGRVEVAPDPKLTSTLSAHEASVSTSVYAPVEVAAGQRVSVENGSWPPIFTAIDNQHATAWLRRQIVFENEPLERVAAEFNRYATTPVEIDSPALRTLVISGVFAADDTDSFVAFLRSLDGVKVAVTPTRIHVSRK